MNDFVLLNYIYMYTCIGYILLEQAQAATAPADAPAPDDTPTTAPLGHEHNSSEYTDASSSDHGGSSGSSSSSE